MQRAVGVLGAVVRQQWMVMRRERRLKVLSAALLIGGMTALLSGMARNERLVAERTAATRADADAWASQGVMNPHSAAHFGQYVFKPVPLLSALDPGALDHLGTMVRLEAHRQSLGDGRPGDAGPALTRFSTFTVASALQMLAPLLVILLAFTTFSGERARSLLTQELGAGIDARALLLGRLIALGGAVSAMLVLFVGAAITVLVMGGAGGAEFSRLALMIVGYGLYLFFFLTVTVGVSALCRSTRGALTTLLAVWMCTVLLVPRVAPAVTAHVRPEPSGADFSVGMTTAVDDAFDAGGPRSERPERLTQIILDRYDVATVDELPVNFSGALLEFTESQSTEIHRRHIAGLHRTYERQAALQRLFAAASPLIALKPWSAALAGTDFAAQHVFLTEAEAYRYAFVQELNRDITLNRPDTRDPYVADVARITAKIDPFEPPVVRLSDVWRRQWADLAILAAWAAAGLGFALACTRIMGRAA